MKIDSHAGQTVISPAPAPAMPPLDRRPRAVRVAVVLSHPIQIDDPAEYRRMARASLEIAAETWLEATVAGSAG